MVALNQRSPAERKGKAQKYIAQGAAALYPGLCAFALTAHNAYGIRVITPRLVPKARSILPF